MSRYLAIDIDPQGLFVVAGTARGGVAKVEHALAWVPGDEHGPPPLTAATAAAIGEQLRDRLKAAGIPLAPALVTVGRDKVILKEVRFPPVPPAEEPAVVRFQAIKEITESPDEVVLDYAPLSNGTPDPAGERRAMAVVVRKDVFAAIQAMCVAAGLKLVAVTPRPYATAAGLARAFAGGTAPPPELPADAAAVLTLGPQGGEFTVARAGQVSFTRSVPSQVMANEAILLGEVRRNLTVFAGQNPGHPVRAVYVAEAEDVLGGWAGRLRAGLAVPVHAFDPVPEVAAVPEGLRGRYAGAAGLLAGQAAGLPINFAAPRQPAVEANPHRKLFAAAGAVAALLLLVGGGLGYWALDAADARLKTLREDKASKEKLLADWEPDRKRLEAADQWAGREVNYLDELFDMADRFPPGDQVRASKFEGTAIRPDRTGKQEAQATVKLQVGAKNPDAAAAVVSAIDRDNTGAAKYYLGTKRLVGGATGTGGFNLASTIETKVNHRPPTGYTRAPSFSPPRRGAVPPGDK
ncbi:MAG: hypothetical protein JWO38_1719 [Gemmataceae bacterium]|nr:hypothetical protein [Gemmataceae bacterium]